MQAAAGQGGDKLYVEDVFSTYLYTGTGTTQSINNEIDLAGEGGMIWSATRVGSEFNGPEIIDTERGGNKRLLTPSTEGELLMGDPVTFNSSGITMSPTIHSYINFSGYKKVLWTFRKAPKFFDVVTYTGSSATQNIPHNLGSVPGMIIVKRTNLSEEWFVYHRSTGASQHLKLNDIDGAGSSFQPWNNTAPTDSVFTVQGGRNEVNNAGSTYVAYLFAHDAGGFGDDGEQNVISCGSFTTDGSANATVNLGWEPQFVIAKRSSNTGAWCIQDNMRGFTAQPTSYSSNPILFANSSDQEITGGANTLQMTSTGFTTDNVSYNANSTYIYIAIRRGPMKTPESGTEVFAPVAYTGNGGTLQTLTTGFPVDMMLDLERPTTGDKYLTDRLRGSSAYLKTSGPDAEGTGFVFGLDNNTGVDITSYFNTSGRTYIFPMFRRAPGFFDVVAYEGNGTAGRTVAHNLGVAPEMIIVKARDYSGGRPWPVYHSGMGNTKFMYLNTIDAESTNTWWNDTTPTSSVFTVGSNSVVNFSGTNYIAYLFATLAGVSKVGSYTGTTSDLNVDCGFSAGARFVLIKRTDSTGDWYVWDSVRGIVAGNDPYLLLNSSATEVTSTDYIDPYSAGFTVTSSAPAALNASGGTYIFLAIA